MFAYPCPFCAQRLLAAPERAGQRTICPKCLKPIVIPRPEGAAEPEPAAVAADAPPAKVASTAGNGDGFVLGGPGVDYGPSQDTPIPPDPPRPPARVAAAVPADLPYRGDSGRVILAPTGVESADLAAELTAALTMRMRPPPEPPGDLKLSTGLWIALTAVGASLLLYALLYNPTLGVYAAILAVVEFAIGYAWVVYLAGKRSQREGLLALLPPVAIDHLLRPRTSQGYRPLRFVLAGVVLFALFLLAPALRPRVQALAGLDDRPPPVPIAPAETTPAAKLREMLAEKNHAGVYTYLRELTEKKDVFRTVTQPPDKADLVAELRKLVKVEALEVRAAALTALLAWADDDAKPEVMAALTATTTPERWAALRVCGRWKDPAVATAVAARLAVRGDRNEAILALRAIGADGGQGVVETGLLPLLATEDDETREEVVLLTREFGGERTVAGLKKLEATAASAGAKQLYRKWWQEVASVRGLKVNG